MLNLVGATFIKNEFGFDCPATRPGDGMVAIVPDEPIVVFQFTTPGSGGKVPPCVNFYSNMQGSLVNPIAVSGVASPSK